MENNNTKHYCPICNTVLNFFTPRYPNAICNSCINNNIVLDSAGNQVSHQNIDLSGGFASLHIIGNDTFIRNDHYCWIKGIKLYADEARFGGIVIQTIKESPSAS